MHVQEHSPSYRNIMYDSSVIEIIVIVGRGGALVGTMTFNQRVVGSTPALTAT